MKIKLALAQLAMSASIEENVSKSVSSIRRAASENANVIAFPEVQLSPFFPQYEGKDASKYLMSINHPAIKKIQEAAACAGIVCIPNIYLSEGQSRFDASPVFDANGDLKGISKMVHVIQAPCFYEQDYYTPSDVGWNVYDTAAGKIGVSICCDRHYPESFRACLGQKAQLVIIPTANHKGEDMELFEAEIRIPAMQNNFYIAMCNRVGEEGDITFAGESLVVDPHGKVIAKAGGKEEILYAELDYGEIARSRKNRPYQNIRQPHHYPIPSKA